MFIKKKTEKIIKKKKKTYYLGLFSRLSFTSPIQRTFGKLKLIKHNYDDFNDLLNSLVPLRCEKDIVDSIVINAIPTKWPLAPPQRRIQS